LPLQHKKFLGKRRAVGWTSSKRTGTHLTRFPIRRATQTNDLITLTNAIKDVVTGSWLFDGHANAFVVVPGGDSGLTISVSADKVANFLGSNYQIVSNDFSVVRCR
jgi:hypothetical protein